MSFGWRDSSRKYNKIRSFRIRSWCKAVRVWIGKFDDVFVEFVELYRAITVWEIERKLNFYLHKFTDNCYEILRGKGSVSHRKPRTFFLSKTPIASMRKSILNNSEHLKSFPPSPSPINSIKINLEYPKKIFLYHFYSSPIFPHFFSSSNRLNF